MGFGGQTFWRAFKVALMHPLYPMIPFLPKVWWVKPQKHANMFVRQNLGGFLQNWIIGLIR